MRKNPNNSIYALLKFFYNNSEELNLTEKLVIKIFKICYGKDMIPTIIKCIMNEKAHPNINKPFAKEVFIKNNSDTWVLIDKVMRDSLEKMNKKDREKTIMSYIKENK